MVLLAYTNSILSFTMLLAMLTVFKSSLNASLRVWQWQCVNKRS